MKSADNINLLIKKLQVKASAELDRRVHDDISSAPAKSKNEQSAQIPPNIWRIIMKNKITKLAVAAVVIIACLIGLSLWRNTGSGIALGDVLARMEQVKAVKYEWTFKCFNGDPNKPWVDEHGTTLTSQQYGSKTIVDEHDRNGSEIGATGQYYYPHQKLEIRINHTQKTYGRRVTDSRAENERSDRQGDPLSSLVKEVLNTKHESIGRSIIDGVQVEGFRTTDPNYSLRGYTYKGPRFTNVKKDPRSDAKLWVDVKTLLPVRIEYLTSDTYDGGETRTFLQEVDHNLQWDVSVDASAFEAPPIPNGYAIQDMFPDLANEENAIGGLKQCVELLGNYPERIDLTYLWSESEKSETAGAQRLKEELKGLGGLERDNKKMDALKPIRFLSKFFIGLMDDGKDVAYYGKTVTPKDTDKVLMRWKVSDSEYRVIYGDLHAETVTPEKLAELEANLPK